MPKEPNRRKAAHRRTKSPVHLQTQETKRAILDAATLLFARKGYEGARMADIAAAANVPRPNLYYHFTTKEQIYRAALGELIQGWDAALTNIVPTRPPAEALEAYVRAKLEHARRNVAKSRLFALEVLQGGAFLKAEDRAHMRAATARAADVIEGWIGEGRLRAVDPRHLLITLWAATQFYADFSMLAEDAVARRRLTAADYDRAAQTIVGSLVHGLIKA